jgi:hypothetical protein
VLLYLCPIILLFCISLLFPAFSILLQFCSVIFCRGMSYPFLICSLLLLFHSILLYPIKIIVLFLLLLSVCFCPVLLCCYCLLFSCALSFSMFFTSYSILSSPTPIPFHFRICKYTVSFAYSFESELFPPTFYESLEDCTFHVLFL